MLGVSAWFILKNRHLDFAKESLKIALVVAFLASGLLLLLGHYHAVQVALTQPEKLAAIEGLFETQSSAPALIFGIPDAENETMHAELKIPGLLSLMAFGKLDATVKGLKDFPKDEWPPLLLTFYPFHLMVALGMYFILLSLGGIYLWWRGLIFENKLFLKLALWSIPLPFIANELGWITAEVGRQPWIVYHLLKTKDAVSVSVPAWQVLVSLILFIIVYAFLFFIWLYLIRRTVNAGPETVEPGGDAGEVSR